jgi:hypothetical protein
MYQNKQVLRNRDLQSSYYVIKKDSIPRKCRFHTTNIVYGTGTRNESWVRLRRDMLCQIRQPSPKKPSFWIYGFLLLFQTTIYHHFIGSRGVLQSEQFFATFLRLAKGPTSRRDELKGQNNQGSRKYFSLMKWGSFIRDSL